MIVDVLAPQQESAAEQDHDGTGTADDARIAAHCHIAETAELLDKVREIRLLNDPAVGVHGCHRRTAGECVVDFRGNIRGFAGGEVVHDDRFTESGRIENILSEAAEDELADDNAQDRRDDQGIITDINAGNQCQDQSRNPSIGMFQLFPDIHFADLEVNRLCRFRGNNGNNCHQNGADTDCRAIDDTVGCSRA